MIVCWLWGIGVALIALLVIAALILFFALFLERMFRF